MRGKILWATVLGLALLLPPLSFSRGQAGEPVKKAQATAALVGTIVAISPESRTLIVDVPLSADVLRIGATVTPSTRITVSGAPAPLESLRVGSRVRLRFRRVTTGNEVIALEVMQGPKG